MASLSQEDDLAATGAAGLDDILRGGFPPNRLYLIQGDPGAGKTTLGLQFLMEGVRQGQSCMYITLSETREEILAVAASHGWSLEGIHLFEMSASDQQLSLQDDNTLFEPSEVELREVMERLLTEIERVKAVRVVFDSLSELRLLSQSQLRFRRRILLLKQFFAGRRCTVLLLDDRTGESDDRQLQSLAHGVLSLDNLPPAYGDERRRLRVIKLRGVQARGGYHEFAILPGGIQAFPRLVAAEHHKEFPRENVSSGIRELDDLLGGGIDRGTATLVMGPAGTGKSSLALRYALSAAERGENAVIFAFDERLETLFRRAQGLGMDLKPHVDSDRLRITQIDPAEIGPGQFACAVHRAAEHAGARVVVIDSLNGYLNAMPEERSLAIQLHELLSVLSQQGVTTFLVMAQHGLLAQELESPVDISYLADTVIVLRYFEAESRVRKAISVLKKRSGRHEETIREYRLGLPEGIRIGQPLQGFEGILHGNPNYVGRSAVLIGGANEGSK